MQRTFTCDNCSTTTLLPFGYSPKCGNLLKCGWCGALYVAHPCNHNHGLSGIESVVKTQLLAVLVSKVTKACPSCGVWYKVGDIVEKVDPQAGQAIKQLALGAGIATLLILAFTSPNK